MLSSGEILKIIEQGESESVEFKASFQKEVIETIVAFANSKGGKILIGVENKGNIVVGVDISGETLNEWINQVKNSTSPAIIPDMEVVKSGSKNIIIVCAPEYPIKPIAYKNRYFKRIRNSNHLMSLEEIANEHLKTINSSWDYYIDTFHDFNDISMDKALNFIQRIERYKNKVFDDDLLTTLQKYELIKNGKITFGAYLLFVDNYSAVTAIQIGRFKSEIKIIDNLTLNSDIFSQIDTVIEFIKKHLMVEYVITGKPDRDERYDYPLEAIREIVINMIVHRDYRDSGDSIIKIFDDRIEFFNPGGLFDDLTIEKLKSGDYVSRARNKLLANMLKECGLIEKYGSGIKRVRTACMEYGINDPVFENFQHGFKVTIQKEKRVGGINGGISGGINGGIKLIVDFIKTNPGVKAGDIVSRLAIPQRTAERILKKLKDEGKVEFKGSKKTGGYFLAR